MLISYILLCKCCFYIVKKFVFLQLQPLCCPCHSRLSHNLVHLQTPSFCFRWQIFPLVRLFVEEQFRDFNQTQYHYIVRIYPHHIGVTQPVLFGHGIGMTENMAVQDAAYSCMTLLREEHALLRDTSFRYIPAALPGEEGYYTGLYSDHSAEDPLLQMTARFARDRDRDARALRFEPHSTRARLYRALTLLAPFVSVGSVEHDAIYPVRTQMPSRVAWPEVGGIIPPHGPLLPPYAGPRPHPCSNGY